MTGPRRRRFSARFGARAAALGLCLWLSACAVGGLRGEEAAVLDAARAYFQVYGERADFERFMAFYAEDAVLQDVVYGTQLSGRRQIAGFFDWSRGGFRRLEAGPILSVTQQLVSGRIVVTRGVFKRFVYGEQTLGPWAFVIWQEYDAQGRIARQDDWINYSPKTIEIGS